MSKGQRREKYLEKCGGAANPSLHGDCLLKRIRVRGGDEVSVLCRVRVWRAEQCAQIRQLARGHAQSRPKGVQEHQKKGSKVMKEKGLVTTKTTSRREQHKNKSIAVCRAFSVRKLPTKGAWGVEQRGTEKQD